MVTLCPFTSDIILCVKLTVSTPLTLVWFIITNDFTAHNRVIMFFSQNFEKQGFEIFKKSNLDLKVQVCCLIGHEKLTDSSIWFAYTFNVASSRTIFSIWYLERWCFSTYPPKVKSWRTFILHTFLRFVPNWKYFPSSSHLFYALIFCEVIL